MRLKQYFILIDYIIKMKGCAFNMCNRFWGVDGKLTSSTQLDWRCAYAC